MIADLAVIFVILLCIFLGYTRGLIKVAVKILSFFIAIIIAVALYTPISNYIIDNTNVVSSLQNTIGEKIYQKEDGGEISENANLSETMQNYIDNYTEGVKENTSDFISREVAVLIVRVGTWVRIIYGFENTNDIYKIVY